MLYVQILMFYNVLFFYVAYQHRYGGYKSAPEYMSTETLFHFKTIHHQKTETSNEKYKS